MKRFLWLLAIALNVVSLLAIASRIEFKETRSLRIACAVGIDDACVTLGWRHSRGSRMEQVPPDPAAALAIFEKACARGGEDSCRSAGDFYNGWPAGSPDIPEDAAPKAFREKIKDRSRAIHFYNAACDGGNPQACESVGTIHRESGDVVKAVEAWKRACKMKRFFGCWHIEQLAKEGNQIAAANVVPPGSRSAFAEWPAGLSVWIGTFLLALIAGIVAAVTRPRAGSPPLPQRTLVIIAGAITIAVVALAIGIRVTADNRVDRLIAYAMAVPALLLAIGTALLAVKGDGTAPRLLLLVGGFLCIPPGLIPIMVVRELRATRATPA